MLGEIDSAGGMSDGQDAYEQAVSLQGSEDQRTVSKMCTTGTNHDFDGEHTRNNQANIKNIYLYIILHTISQNPRSKNALLTAA